MIVVIASAGGILFVAVALFLAALAHPGIGELYYGETIVPATFIGKPVFVLGESNNTCFIVERLRESTNEVTVLEDTSNLSAVGPRDILMIDGAWASGRALVDLASHVRPLILQGTPVILLNTTPDLLNIALGNDSLEFSCCYEGESNGEWVQTMFSGLIYFPIENRTAVISLGHMDSTASFANLITSLYEWSALRT